jgi:hypothetical protein
MESYLNGTGLPNCQYESHVVHFDSVTSDGTAANDFTVRLRTPLKDIVTAQLISASVHSGGSDVVGYLIIDELMSGFNTKAGNTSGNVITSDQVSAPFAKLLLDAAARTSYKAGDYPVFTEFIRPIERLSRMRMRLIDQGGTGLLTLSGSTETFFTIRFVCMRQNLCRVL